MIGTSDQLHVGLFLGLRVAGDFSAATATVMLGHKEVILIS